MKVSIIGSGYVGLVAAACFAEMGNTVMCIDINEDKIKKLKKGIIPIYEPGLEKLVLNNLQKGDLSFSTDIVDALKFDIVFIAVGTPMGDDGSADLKYVFQVAEKIGENIWLNKKSLAQRQLSLFGMVLKLVVLRCSNPVKLMMLVAVKVKVR